MAISTVKILGNGLGTVIKIKGYYSPVEKSVPRSFAQVQWYNGNKANNYRVGFRGKVDLTCKKPATGPTVYINHLPDAGYLLIDLSLHNFMQISYQVVQYILLPGNMP